MRDPIRVLGVAWMTVLLAPVTVTSQAIRPSAGRQAIYYPGPGDEWERRTPAQVA